MPLLSKKNPIASDELRMEFPTVSIEWYIVSCSEIPAFSIEWYIFSCSEVLATEPTMDAADSALGEHPNAMAALNNLEDGDCDREILCLEDVLDVT